ncbi:GIY-YIG nuclease family protein [Hymenobacter jeollabukensis]|uniref:GIY-YIG nuclease family protein n=1 Tax=Hymenobacter jeollabukensis TaxID=2025313 RepID=A0A5R8WRE1_9BACT|nr:GIY-YIG nuclease family protein [Hymenobacter jeollabukensis]TLM93090.1 GIY-YIG nuclease family protein [Hymenobacter jeollabukensis]
MHHYYVYILTNQNSTVLYVGVTNDLIRRVAEHREGQHKGFTKRYNLNKLVYFEEYPDAKAAIAREKQLKPGNRQKKLDAVNAVNPNWAELLPE